MDRAGLVGACTGGELPPPLRGQEGENFISFRGRPGVAPARAGQSAQADFV